MKILIGDEKIDWFEEKTKRLQITSLTNFAMVLGYKPCSNENIGKGFITNKSKFVSYYKGTNYISLSDMCKLHNFINEDEYKKEKKDYRAAENALSVIKLKNKELFDKRDMLLSLLLNASYPLKLVEKVKLQKDRKEYDGVKVQSNLVKVTKLGETYLEQNFFIFRKNQVLIE